MNIMIADDHRLIREGIKALVDGDSSINVIDEVSSREQLESALEEQLPDVLILDISMEGRHSGLEFLETHQGLLKNTHVLILSMSENISLVKRAIDLGAAGYLPKGETSDCLLPALHTVASGTLYFAPSIAHQLLQIAEKIRSGEDFSPHTLFTKREFTIFSLLGRGYTANRVAKKLDISTSTVSTHMENMKGKLGVASTNELVRAALKWSSREDS